MPGIDQRVLRRDFLATAGAAAIGAASWPSHLRAVELSAVEQANVKVVNDMCAAWVAPLDSAKLGGLFGDFFADECVFRASETTPPKTGRATVLEFFEGIMGDVTHCEFEVGDTFARGSIVAHGAMGSFRAPYPRERVARRRRFLHEGWPDRGVERLHHRVATPRPLVNTCP